MKTTIMIATAMLSEQASSTATHHLLRDQSLYLRPYALHLHGLGNAPPANEEAIKMKTVIIGEFR